MAYSNLLILVFSIVLTGADLFAQPASKAPIVYKVLLIDGQNNHKRYAGFEQISPLLKRYLEETGLFSVDIATTPPEGESVANFSPAFVQYDAVISNYNGAPWSSSTQLAFEHFVKKGGGFVVIHAADNAFPDWKAYNQMIGLGGWGGRNENWGPYVYFGENGLKQLSDDSPGVGGHHGSQHEFSIKIRDKNHPITKGMPDEWMHTKEELYDRLRGPAKKMNVLAIAYSSKKYGGSERYEPMMMTIRYGKGRIFHTPMGHSNIAVSCIGFKVTLQRAVEWVISGKVTQSLPTNFPGPNQSRSIAE